ncbi:PPC domain-containing protein [Leptolyngbya sp. FACHB-711]|uniref:PPC domain-containing protein n=1 Tax=unclassified Leptolyngbya TaxID=2650499 RepID=UPI001683D6FE|nr:PPC domain-containing protein [Leptolyngbya sp. FACHB-711]MBD1850309.1 PPC domain-containing protein [Cyanobacteria bacterium FACHB-502]MBD2026648.1 PPC domain-containing protein [Leptolyngbya sp. FACHB-711]
MSNRFASGAFPQARSNASFQLQTDSPLFQKVQPETQRKFLKVSSSRNSPFQKMRFAQSGNSTGSLKIQPISATATANQGLAGNSLSTANNLGNLSGRAELTWNGSIGGSTTDQYFRMNLSRSLRFRLTLSQLSANADLSIVRQNGDSVARSLRGDRQDERIEGNLRAGTYFIRVSAGTTSTNYTLKLKGSGFASDAGNTTLSALDAGNISRLQRSYQGRVDSKDNADVYKFSLSEAGQVALNLKGLSEDADIQLLSSTGAELGRSGSDGQTEETIQQQLNVGSYFVRVTPFDSDRANYTLSMTGGTGASAAYVPSPSPIPAPSPTPGGGATSSGSAPGTSLSTASVQSAAFSRSDQLSASNREDFYRFSLSQSGTFTANLSGLTGDADVRLIQDKNNNGAIDPGEVLGWQWEWGATGESVRRFLSAGNYFVQVMGYGNQSMNYTVNTNFTPSGSDDRKFSMQVNFADGIESLNFNVRNAITEAAKFWENAITHSSFNGSHLLQIDVQGVNSPQAWLAAATNRSGATDAKGNWMPTTGIVRINTSYSNSYNSDPSYLKTLVIHELGHVLGIGTLWEKQGRSLIDRGSNTYKADSYAGRAYGEISGILAPKAIPVEAGTFGHWDEGKFGDELLTPFAEGATVKMPLSQVTLASLRDIGWNVNYGAADSFSVTQSVLAPEGLVPSGTTVSGCGCSMCANVRSAAGLDEIGSGSLMAAITA